jgi:hypothetical protein
MNRSSSGSASREESCWSLLAVIKSQARMNEALTARVAELEPGRNLALLRPAALC